MFNYSIASFSSMIHDRVRMEAYESALKAAVKPGAVVVDIGSGTGILSFLACQYGAKKVYAIEPNDAIHLAREMAKANGFADRIEFIQGMSTEVELAEKADVIVSDLRGVTPLNEHHLPTIVHAREQLLAPGGRLIPQRDRLWAALVEAPKEYEGIQKSWQFDYYDFDLSTIRKSVTNTPQKIRAEPEQLIMEPQRWAALDYEQLTDSHVEGEVQAVATRAGVAHALCLWFDTDLRDGVGFSNAPGCPEAIYGQWLLPLSEPIELAAGDAIGVQINAYLVGDDYIWQWDTTVHGADKREAPKAALRQSTFANAPVTLPSLQKHADTYIPELNQAGAIDREILASMAQRLPLGEIASRMAEEFPQRFQDWKSALTHVGELAQKYSR